MCELCSNDKNERDAARAAHLFHADQMDTLAEAYRRMVAGKLDPHSDEASKIGRVARSLVQHLVSEWI